MRRRVEGDETGAYLILYALLAVVFFTLAAIVLDLAALRQGRSADRTAADLAATAGAADIRTNDAGSAAIACSTAWGYLIANRSDTPGTVTAPNCSGTFTPQTCTSSTPPRTATGSIGAVTVQITYPVPRSSPLMRAEVQGGDVPQAIGPADGRRCDRFAVRIIRPRTFLFGRLAGVTGSTTDVHSVARPIIGAGSRITPLVTLDPAGCPGIDAAGGTITAIAPGGGNDEAIAVDTTSCSGGTTAISSSGGGAVRAEQLPAGSAGFARVTAATNIGSLSFGAVRAPAVATGAAPVETRYNTTPAAGCGANPCSASTVAAALGAGVPAGYIVATTLPGFDCTSASVAAVFPLGVPAGNYYVDCPAPGGFTVNSNLALSAGSTVVFTGPVTINNPGCLSVAAPACLIPAPGTPSPSLLFIRAGGLIMRNNTNLVLNGTTVFLANGALDLDGGPNGIVWWRAPTVNPLTCSGPACVFDDLLLWSRTSTVLHRFNTPAGLNLEGVLYVPAATLQFDSAATGIGSEGFQVYAERVRATSGTVQLKPTVNRAVLDLRTTTRLLR